MKSFIKNILRNTLPQPIKMYIHDFYSHEYLEFSNYIKYFINKNGIEVGGPSRVFRKFIPIYKVARKVDGLNFSNFTTWENIIIPGDNNYRYFKSQNGCQYIGEASDLHFLNENVYQFLISSNCLEHCANPIKVLLEWGRVISVGGVILLIVPNKSDNFDRKRDDTSFAHMLEDYNNNIDESDLTHLDEILEKHDLTLDPAALNRRFFEERCLSNLNNRCMHHHIFSFNNIRALFEFCNLDVIFLSQTQSDYICLARKK